MKKIILLFIATFLFVSFNINDNQWITLATKHIAYKTDTDYIHIPKKNRNIDRIKIKCIQGTFKLKKVYVEMSDGKTKDFDASSFAVFTKGMYSLPLILPGENNHLIKIKLEYESLGNVLVTNRAKIEILGRTY